MLAVASFRIRSPKGPEELEIFPNQPFFWTNNQMLLCQFPIGSRYFRNEVRPLVGPIDALKFIILPRFRGDVGDLRVLYEKALADLAESLGAGKRTQPGILSQADGAKVRIEYQLDGGLSLFLQGGEGETGCSLKDISGNGFIF